MPCESIRGQRRRFGIIKKNKRRIRRGKVIRLAYFDLYITSKMTIEKTSNRTDLAPVRRPRKTYEEIQRKVRDANLL